MKKTEFIGLRVSPELKNALQKIAEEQDRTISYVANKVLCESLIKGKVTGDKLILPDEFARD